MSLFGYDFVPEYGWHFPNKSTEYFTSYVETFFKMKSEETGAKRSIAK